MGYIGHMGHVWVMMWGSLGHMGHIWVMMWGSPMGHIGFLWVIRVNNGSRIQGGPIKSDRLAVNSHTDYRKSIVYKRHITNG